MKVDDYINEEFARVCELEIARREGKEDSVKKQEKGLKEFQVKHLGFHMGQQLMPGHFLKMMKWVVNEKRI